jgi:hypothetical protein
VLDSLVDEREFKIISLYSKINNGLVDGLVI